jgi:hypothetical protein
MTTVLFLGGIFNIVDPIIGLTLYMWSWIVLTVFIIAAWLIMYFKGWKPFAPLHGLYYAMKNSSTVAFIFDALLVGELVAERDAKCIFNYEEEDYEIEPSGVPVVGFIVDWFNTKLYYYPTKYLPDIDFLHAIVYKIGGVNKDVEIARKLEGGDWERSATVVCGGVPVDIVIDMNYWTIRTSKEHKAIVRTARIWNEANPTDQVHSYRKYQDYLMNRNIPVPAEIHESVLIPWQRIDAAFPLDLDENEWAGKKWQKAKENAEEDEQFIRKITIYIIVGGLAFAAFLLLIRFALAAISAM